MSQLLYRLGRLAARRCWRMVAVWVVIAAAVIGLSQTAGASFTNDYRVPGVESQRAADLLQRSFPAMAGADATVVFHAQRGTVRDPRAKAGIAATLAELRRQPQIVEVDDPLDPRAGTVSPDASVAFATVRSNLQPGEVTPEAFRGLDRAADAARRAGLAVEFRGAIVDVASQPETGAAELFGLAAAVLILLVAFGSVVAVGLPIGTALVGLLVGLSGVTLVGALVDIPTIAPLLAVMIGIGVGIDYALFVVTRFRQSLADGLTVPEAAGRANATAGQSVVFAGGTVVIAILGLWLTGIPFVGAMGLATAVVVAVAVLAAVTLLPALLGVIGRRIDQLRLPALRRRSQGAGPARSAWTRWGRTIDRHAWAYALGALLVLLALATPLLALRLGTPDDGTLPTSATQRRAYDLLASGFGPGFNGPLLLAVKLPPDNRQAPDRRMLLDRLARAAAADPDVAAVTQPALSPSGDAAVLTVLPNSSPQDQATTDLVTRLRHQVIPTARGDSGAQIYVGGLTATILDLASQVADRLLLFIVAVVAVSFLLLVIVFRALLVPLKAALLNLLSIGAAYGVVVAIFQWGWARGLVGLETTVPIMSFVPMLMFAILFGLSMDYEVFLLSRIREEYVATGDAHGSVVTAIAATARVITSAALIMVCVFVGFVFSPDPVLKMVGVGLAVAVAIDATIVRVVLVPALMSLLGDRAWWLPRWLDRTLPSVNLDATTPASINAPTMDAPSAGGRTRNGCPDTVGLAVTECVQRDGWHENPPRWPGSCPCAPVPARRGRSLVPGRDLRQGGRPLAPCHRAIDQFGQVIDVFVPPQRDAKAARRFVEQAITTTRSRPGGHHRQGGDLPDRARRVAPGGVASHRQDANHHIEADHGRLTSMLGPMRGLKQDRSAKVVLAGHGLVQDLRRGHDEPAVEEPVIRRVAVAFDELAVAT